jgi:hypothetical protein
VSSSFRLCTDHINSPKTHQGDGSKVVSLCSIHSVASLYVNVGVVGNDDDDDLFAGLDNNV